MENGVIRWIRVLRLGDVAGAQSRLGHAIVVTPPQWAQAMASLIKLSDEYRQVGLLVTNVGPSSQAATVGIERGDVLLRYDGVPLEHTEQLTSLEGVLAQGQSARPVALDAVSGEREMTFTVAAGPLGITVSPLLHRLGSTRRSPRAVIRAGQENDQDERAVAGETTLVEVPGELVPQVSLLAQALQRPSNAKQRKRVEALLATAAGMG